MRRCFNLLSIVIFLFILNGCKNSTSELLGEINDLGRKNLRGNVKELTVSYYKITDGKNYKMPLKYLDKKECLLFNRNGFLTQNIKYNWNGGIEEQIRFEYHKNGKISFGTDGEYLYDKSGKLYQTIKTNLMDGRKKKTEYNYDSEGRLSEKRVYDYDGQLIYHYNFVYNINNQLIESSYKYYGNALTFRTNEKKQYFYVSNNRQKTIITTGINSDYSEIQELRYNEKNDLIYQKITGSPEDRELTYSYEYDSFFNWIIKREYLNGGLVLLEERTIEYYP